MVSKAIERSSKKRALEWPASRAIRISFYIYKSTVLEEWNLRFADLNLVKRSWEERCVRRQFAIKCVQLILKEKRDSKLDGNFSGQ